MQTLTISHFRKDVYKTVENAIKFEPIRINTKNGNAILISEDEFAGWQETLYLCSIPGMKESILEGNNTGIDACIKEEDFKW